MLGKLSIVLLSVYRRRRESSGSKIVAGTQAATIQDSADEQSDAVSDDSGNDENNDNSEGYRPRKQRVKTSKIR
jgi:hypothetical protein